MKHLRNLTLLSLAVWLSALSVPASFAELETRELKTPGDTSLDTVERNALQTVKPEIHGAAPGTHIESVPVYVAGKSAWVTVLDSRDRPAAAVSVLVNGQPQDTDENGIVAFRVPNSGALSLALVDNDKREVDRKDFELVTGGLLVAHKSASAVRALFGQNVYFGRLPVLVYAPAVLEAAEKFVLLGTNIGAGDTGKVMLDGSPLPVLSSSPAAVLARVQANAALGPLKQIYVTGPDSISSNVLEVDVARSEVSYDRKGAERGSDIDARLAVYGTNLPALVTILDEQPDVASINLADGTKLGDRVCVLVPGGQQNALPARMQIKQKGEPVFCTSLQSDGASILQSTAESAPLAVPLSLWLSLYEAQLVKLKQRLVAVQARLAETKEEVDKSGQTAEHKNGDSEKTAGILKALSLREDALSMAIAARRRLFLAAGGSEAQFNKLIDDATGGAYYVIESRLRDADLPINSPVVATTLPPVEKPRMSRRLLRALAEPRIILLPPLDMLPIGQAPLPGPTENAIPAPAKVEAAPSAPIPPPAQKTPAPATDSHSQAAPKPQGKPNSGLPKSKVKLEEKAPVKKTSEKADKKNKRTGNGKRGGHSERATRTEKRRRQRSETNAASSPPHSGKRHRRRSH